MNFLLRVSENAFLFSHLLKLENIFLTRFWEIGTKKKIVFQESVTDGITESASAKEPKRSKMLGRESGNGISGLVLSKSNAMQRERAKQKRNKYQCPLEHRHYGYWKQRHHVFHDPLLSLMFHCTADIGALVCRGQDSQSLFRQALKREFSFSKAGCQLKVRNTG